MKTLSTIDINCDLGEGSNELDCQKDRQLMQYISSCNIACGGHAGNQLTMTHSLRNAKNASLKIGAHPGYPDRKNFGRISLDIKYDQLEQSLYSQIQTLASLANTNKVDLTHIKFHGALYNDIEKNDLLAKLMVEFCQRHFPSMSLLGLAGGNLKKYCQVLGVRFVAEGFMDRRYLATGKLSPRSLEGSVITDSQAAIRQAIALTKGKSFSTVDHSLISLTVDSICLHGDNPHAIDIAKLLVAAFKDNHIVISEKQN